MVITPTVYLIKKTAEIIIDKVINKVISGEKVDDVSKSTLSNSKDFLAVQKNDSGSNLQIIYTAPSNTTPVTFNNGLSHLKIIVVKTNFVMQNT
jgi:hypothetical protein